MVNNVILIGEVLAKSDIRYNNANEAFLRLELAVKSARSDEKNSVVVMAKGELAEKAARILSIGQGAIATGGLDAIERKAGDVRYPETFVFAKDIRPLSAFAERGEEGKTDVQPEQQSSSESSPQQGGLDFSQAQMVV